VISPAPLDRRKDALGFGVLHIEIHVSDHGIGGVLSKSRKQHVTRE